MSNMIDFNVYKKGVRESIEKGAYERFGILKINNDTYVLPEVVFISGSSELREMMDNELGMGVEELLEKNVIDEINDLISDGDSEISIKDFKGTTTRSIKPNIKILLQKQEGDMLSMELINTTKDRSFLLTTPMKFNRDNRRILTGIIADAVNIVGVKVEFVLVKNFKEISEIVKNT